jgi:Dolichyl-phosphate-mannose-protein mannosyltransferase
MYLGPMYYYMMAPFLALFGLSPVGPAVGVALLGVATVFLLWYVARIWFGRKIALVASFLYAISPVVIVYSRSSWNPNIMPFFALFCIFSIWKVWRDKSLNWLVWGGLSMAAVLQSHYLGLLLQPVFWLFLALSFISLAKIMPKDARSPKVIFSKIVKHKVVLREFFVKLTLGLLGFAALMSPLVIFDARHGFRNANSLIKFFTERQTTVSFRPWNAIPEIPFHFEKTISRMLTAGDMQLARFIALFIVVAFVIQLFKTRFRVSAIGPASMFLVFVWLVSAYVGFGLYKQEIYDHYFGFIFPALFLAFGASLWVYSKYKIGVVVSSLVVFLLVWVNLSNHPLRYAPNNQLPRTREVAEFILSDAKGEKFNFAVIAERNYEGAYEYFLEDDKNFRRIDPQKADETITEQLYVACEMPLEKCQPVGNAKAEVAGFGPSRIDKRTNVSGVEVFRLVRVNSGK